MVGIYEWIVWTSWQWRRLSHHPALSRSFYLPFKIICSSKIGLLHVVFQFTLITLELGAISSLFSIFPVCAFNVSSSFSADWNRNLNIGLLAVGKQRCLILWSTLTHRSENRPVATMASHFQPFQIHTNLQILAGCTFPLYLTVSDPLLLVLL